MHLVYRLAALTEAPHRCRPLALREPDAPASTAGCHSAPARTLVTGKLIRRVGGVHTPVNGLSTMNADRAMGGALSRQTAPPASSTSPTSSSTTDEGRVMKRRGRAAEVDGSRAARPLLLRAPLAQTDHGP